MKLVRVKLKNFRCYKDETTIDIGDLTTLIGKNECGKSSILDALQIFFDDLTPDTDDATTDGDKSDVRITCEFAELPSQLIIDADYPTSLRDEYMINEEEHLEICRIYNCTLQKPKPNTYAVAQHPVNAGIEDILTLKNEGLKRRAQELNIDTSEIDLRINTQLRKIIWDSAQDLQLESKFQDISAVFDSAQQPSPDRSDVCMLSGAPARSRSAGRCAVLAFRNTGNLFEPNSRTFYVCSGRESVNRTGGR